MTEITVGKNAARPRIDMFWREMKPVADDAYRRECPFCGRGMFLLGRDKSTYVLQENDRCLYCGQQIRYMDIEELRSKEVK